jgi:hypothetical protein
LDARSGAQGKCKPAAADGLGIPDGADVHQERTLDSDEADVRQFGLQPFDRISADVRGVAAADRHIVAVRLDVLDVLRIQRIQSAFTLTDEKR